MAKPCYYISDAELGTIFVRPDVRARHLILHIRPDGSLLVTLPPGAGERELRAFVDTFRSEAKRRLSALTPKVIDWGFVIDAPSFRFTVERGGRGGFHLRGREREYTLLCPPDTDFSSRQPWLRKVVEEAMRRRAGEVLPGRTARLSERAALPYRSLKINTSKGRWGSCSTRGDINLSCSLVLLPEHLTDYVILHELCHTVEMNHSPRFWALLDRFTGDAHALRRELGAYHTFTT